ncbi:MAG: hypothetical protein QGI21_00470 [Candidatus Poseidoniaceae archaeon]|jgi:tRNA threonylcarbamoyladenosine modification (KEOPS) complex Cgi121 subunit|nr:hypothetical protein [Candidatus Poseidoniaceae archaeon]
MVVSQPQFPCVRVKFPEALTDSRSVVMRWIDVREDASWVLVCGDSLASEVHGWVALTVMNRNHKRDKMKSNSRDAEFMRLISGTHHVSASFKRAGLINGDTEGWIIHLDGDMNSDFDSHVDKMGFTKIEVRPSIELFSAERMGIENGSSEDVAIGHIHLADLR